MEHQLQKGHDFDWDNVTILDEKPYYRKRLISEIIFIRRQIHRLNLQTIWRDFSMLISRHRQVRKAWIVVSQCRSYAVMSLSGVFIDYFSTFLFLELINALMLYFSIYYFRKVLAKKQKVTLCLILTDWHQEPVLELFL